VAVVVQAHPLPRPSLPKVAVVAAVGRGFEASLPHLTWAQRFLSPSARAARRALRVLRVRLAALVV
jgi:hypothetical protein